MRVYVAVTKVDRNPDKRACHKLKDAGSFFENIDQCTEILVTSESMWDGHLPVWS